MFGNMLRSLKKKKSQKTVGGQIDAQYKDNLVGNFQKDMSKDIASKMGGGRDILNTSVKPGFVPAGMDKSLFSLNTESLNPGQVRRRQVLDKTAPKLQRAIASRDIFAYNAALSSLRAKISRTEGGPRLPQEMPDAMELRRRSRIRQHRRPVGSREQTMLGIF